MDGVGSAASLSQLAVYVHCTIQRLRHLYQAFTDAKFLARSQLEELHVLLRILDRIGKNHSSSDTELLVPVLLSISNTVQTLKNWFDPSSTLRLKWNLIAHKTDIEEAFRLLRQKYNLLTFYYSERNNHTLSRIESNLKAHCHFTSGSSEIMSSPNTQNIETSVVETQSNQFNPAHHTRIGTRELAFVLSANSTSGQNLLPNHRPNGMQSEEPPGQKEGPSSSKGQPQMQFEESPGQKGGPSSSKEGQAQAKFVTSDNKHFMAKVEAYNNTLHPATDLETAYTNNVIVGGSFSVGNQQPYHDNNERA